MSRYAVRRKSDKCLFPFWNGHTIDNAKLFKYSGGAKSLITRLCHQRTSVWNVSISKYENGPPRQKDDFEVVEIELTIKEPPKNEEMVILETKDNRIKPILIKGIHEKTS